MRFGGSIIPVLVMILVMQGDAAAGVPVTRSVEAEAVVPIYCEDVGAAREAALIEASRRAVEALGVTIDSETLYLKGIQEEDVYDLRWRGFVQEYSILEHGRVGRNYRVRIRARIADDRTNAPRIMLHEMTILIHPEGPGSSAVTKLLVDELSTAGCRNIMVDGAAPARNADSPPGGRGKADLLVTVRSSLECVRWSEVLSGSWFHGEASIDLSRLHAGAKGPHLIRVASASNRIVCGSERPGTGMTEGCMSSLHPNSFSRQVAEPVVDAFMRDLAENEVVPMGERVVMIEARNVRSKEACSKFLSTIRQLRGVMGKAELSSWRETECTVKVIYPMKARYLAYLLESVGSYRVLSYDWKSIDLEFM